MKYSVITQILKKKLQVLVLYLNANRFREVLPNTLKYFEVHAHAHITERNDVLK